MVSTDTTDEDRLVELYRSYIGEPDRRTDVYLGFALFFGGLGLGIIGLFLFVVERAVLEGLVFGVREVAFAMGALGLPLVLVAVVVLLPWSFRLPLLSPWSFRPSLLSPCPFPFRLRFGFSRSTSASRSPGYS